MAQTRFEATHIAVRTISDSTKRVDQWENWRESSVIIIITNRIVRIYSNVEQEYIIISQIENATYKNATVRAFDAIDVNNSRCTVEILNYDTGLNQLYIRWPYLEIAYQFKKI